MAESVENVYVESYQVKLLQTEAAVSQGMDTSVPVYIGRTA